MSSSSVEGDIGDIKGLLGLISSQLDALSGRVDENSKRVEEAFNRIESLEKRDLSYGTPKVKKEAGVEGHINFTDWKQSVEDFDEDLHDFARKRESRNDFPRHRNSERRRSFFAENMENVERIVQERGQVVTFYTQQPDYSRIRLERLGIKESFYFFKAINEYYLKYKINLPVGTLLSSSVRGTLGSYFRAHRVTSDSIYGMQASQLLPLVQSYVQPTNEPAFVAALKSIVKFRWSGAVVNFTTNFGELYDAILEYTDNFRALVEFMSEGNNPEAVPRVSNSEKSNGLIYVYFSKFPKGCGIDDYPKNVMASLQREYGTLDEFLEAFRDKLDSSKQRAKESMEELHALGINLVYNKGNPSGTPYHGGQSRVNYQSGGGNRAPIFEKPSVKVIEEDFLDTEERIDDDVTGDFHEQRSISEDDFEEDVIEDLKELNVISKPFQSSVESTSGTKGSKERLANGCFNLLYHGECNKGSACNRSHDTSVLRELHGQVMKLLRNSKYAPVSKLERPAYSRDNVKQKPSFITDKMVNVMEEILLITTSCNSVLPPMHAQGKLRRNQCSVDVRCLFDTGASHANYISEKFVNANRDFFEGIITKYFSRVLLGDSTSTIQVKGKITVELAFNDGDREYTATVPFHVIQHDSNDVIIGLPSSCTDFSEYFLQLFSTAMQNYEGDQSLYSVEENQVDSNEYSKDAGLLIDPWNSKLDANAPEDEETPLPVSFSEALHFMEMTPEEALEEFIKQIPEHVSEEFRSGTKVVDMLMDWGYKAFIPQNWTGINGLEPFSCEFKLDMPEHHRPSARPINPRLYENAKKEFDRLSKYFYVPSDSSIASCLVIAPKATAPFIRFCGDYVWVNQYLVNSVRPVPHVLRQIERVRKFKIFVDIDMANSFHQILLSLETSRKLSVSTPWGLVRPLFMPEGIGPASGMLQHVVYGLFKDFEPWCICIFDNILILADDIDDAFNKLCLFLRRCIERNVYMKFSKSWLGFREVTFFGYRISHTHFSLTDERKLAISSLPFPGNVKQMQSFLGAALYFTPFVPNFASLAAPMYDMTRKDFDWKPSTWTLDYKVEFDKFIAAIVNALALYYPDYELPWFVRTDACLRGIGGGFYQEKKDEHGNVTLQPLGFVSKKFSDAAANWATIEQEAYAIFYTIKYFSYYLRGKPFILQTDHNNLLWMSASEVPKIIRWRIYLQGFAFMIQHIPGKLNVMADFLSRTFPTLEDSAEHLNVIDSEKDNIIDQVHNGRMGHVGVRRTWHRLNQYFPGHNISYRVLEDYVLGCPVCQQDRRSIRDKLEPVVRHLKVEYLHSTVGVDCLAVTPEDIHGNKMIIVVVVFYTKFVYLHPAKEYTAITMATALFKFFCTFGLFDRIISDPGSNLTADVVQILHKWLGVRHVFSLVDRHESNGVEGSNKQILRHLRALVTDERVKEKWSDDTVLPIIALILNTEVHSETGVRPMDATFGTHNATYHQIPTLLPKSELSDRFIANLNNNLRAIAEASAAYQQSLVEVRTKDQPIQNIFQPGDFILFDSQRRRTKLSLLLSGPYEVIKQLKNDIECRHLAMGNIVKLHVDRVQLFHGNREDAVKMAKVDADQMTIVVITGYQGDPCRRSTLVFETVFEDGDILWLPWNSDIVSSVQFEDFCRAWQQLNCLLFSAKEAQRQVNAMNKTAIQLVKPGDMAWVDLRSFGEEWYIGLDIPDKYHTVYLVRVHYKSWANRSRTQINAEFPIFDELFAVDHYFVFCFGSLMSLPTYSHQVVDADFVKRYPSVLPEQKRDKILTKLEGGFHH